MNKYVITVFLLIYSISIAQDSSTPNLPTIIPPSPTVASLMKLEEVDLNQYTGQPNIVIPLLTKQNNDFNYEMSLIYQVSGIREIEQSGWVGTGWSLNSSAVVSRTVVGIPDEVYKIPNSTTSGKIGVNYNNFFNFWNWDYNEDDPNNYVLPSLGNPNQRVLPVYLPASPAVNTDMYKINQFTYNAQWAKEAVYDYQRDIYQFNIFGVSGRFIFDRLDPSISDSPLIPKIIGENRNLLINVNYSSNTESPYIPKVIESFEIVTDSGLKLTFDEVEVTDSSNLTFTKLQYGSSSVISTNDIPPFRSSWKISKVENLQGEVLVSFEYDDIIESPKHLPSYTENEIDPEYLETLTLRNMINQGGSATAANRKDVLESAMLPKRIYSQQLNTINSKKLRKIKFLDGSEIRLTFDQNHPEYTGSRLLTLGLYENEISLQPIKGYEFNYNSSLSLSNKHLFLDSINQINSSGGLLSYTLEYNNPDLLEEFGTGKTDLFGYHDSGNSFNYKEELLSGSLKSITYPTGLMRVIKWEPSTYSFIGDRQLSFLEIIENADNTISQTDFLNYSGSGSNYSAPETFYISYDQNVRVDFDFTDTPEAQSSPLYSFAVKYIPILTSNYNSSEDTTRDRGNLFFHRSDESSGSGEVFLKKGWYKAGGSFDENLTGAGNSFSILIAIESKNIKTGSLNWFKYGGGLRVQSISDYDDRSFLSKKSINYSLESLQPNFQDYPLELWNSGVSPISHHLSSGSFDGILSLNREYLKTVRPIVNLSGTIYPVLYNVKEILNASEAQLTQGNFVGYKNVAIYKTSSARESNNKFLKNVIGEEVIKYSFDSSIDFPHYDESEYTYPFRTKTSKDYLKGNLRSKLVYNKLNQLLSHTSFEYNSDKSDIEKLVASRLHFAVNDNHFVDEYNNYRFNDFIWFHDLGYNHPQWERHFYNNYQDYLSKSPSHTSGILGTAIISSGTYPFEDNRVVDDQDIRLTTHYMYFTPLISYNSQLISKTTKEYFYDNAGQTEEMVQSIEYEYDPKNYQVNKQTTINSKNEVLTLETVFSSGHFPANWDSSLYSATEMSVVDQMKIANRTTAPLLSKSYINNELISTTQYIYDEPMLNKFITREVRTSKGDSPMESRLIYHRYDQLGNVLEVSKTDGTRISYIYGYNKTLPVAKIEGLSYSELALKLGVTENQLDAFNEGDLLTLNGLRSSFSVDDPFVITTYEYKVGVGITKVTDPRGRSMTYKYDDFNRLEQVIDHEGNILSKNEYKYATQN